MGSFAGNWWVRDRTFFKSVKGTILLHARPAFRLLKPPPAGLLEPMSRRWGFERGTPISRWFIDRFMEANSKDITGAVLEIKNPRYTKSFGQGVTVSDVLDIDETNTTANVFADLATADNVESSKYDCFILTETLQFVFNLDSAISHAHRMLKPDGVLLVSVPCVSPSDDELAHVDHWRFTTLGCEKLFGNIFGIENVQVTGFGNYAVSAGYLAGLAIEELPEEKLHEYDGKYTTGILIRAQRK